MPISPTLKLQLTSSEKHADMYLNQEHMVFFMGYSCIGGSPLHRRNRKIAANLSTLTQTAISFSALPQEARTTEFAREGDASSLKGGYSLAIHQKCNHSSMSQCETLHFRVEALVTQCSPHSAGREDFPHPVPRFQPFSPD